MMVFRCHRNFTPPPAARLVEADFPGFQRLSFGAGMYTFHDVPINFITIQACPHDMNHIRTTSALYVHNIRANVANINIFIDFKGSKNALFVIES